MLLWNAHDGLGKNRKSKANIHSRSTLARYLATNRVSLIFNNFSETKLSRSQSDFQSRGRRTSGTADEASRQTADSYRQPRPPSSVKLEKQESRDRIFEQRQARTLSSKLAHSGKNAARYDAWTPKTNTTASDDLSTTNYEQVDTFICGGCDKIYTTRKDLDIHKSFCYDLKI